MWSREVAMALGAKRQLAFSLAAVVIAAGGLRDPSDSAAANEVPWTRSLYFPVVFSLCPHLEQGRMFEGERPVAALPFKRIFQFTYYSEKKGFFPETQVVDVLASNPISAKVIRATLVVTPGEIRLGDRVIYHAGPEQVATQLRRHKDARFSEATVRLHRPGCPSSCAPPARSDCDDCRGAEEKKKK
jgi:hypothetical protein